MIVSLFNAYVVERTSSICEVMKEQVWDPKVGQMWINDEKWVWAPEFKNANEKVWEQFRDFLLGTIMQQQHFSANFKKKVITFFINQHENYINR